MTNPPRQHTAEHRTVVLGRTLNGSLDRIYAAVSEPLERARIGAAGDGCVLLLDESDFRVGGRDAFRFGPKGNPRFHGEAIYHQIVPRALVVATEVVHAGDHCVSVTLTTLALLRKGEDTDLKLTAQVLALCDDPDLIDEAGARHQAWIETLAEHFGAAPEKRRRPFLRR
ncbi:MAG: SRPBCC domain-containing protein [Hyphomicrobiaceae bacterium]